jgi:uncharacterized membrane protein YraQ (UPF0718 family)
MSTTDRMRGLTDPALIAVLESIRDDVAALTKAFPPSDEYPQGDLSLHRRLHEEELEYRKQRREVLTQVSKTIATWGILGIIGLAIAGAIQYIAKHLP